MCITQSSLSQLTVGKPHTNVYLATLTPAKVQSPVVVLPIVVECRRVHQGRGTRICRYENVKMKPFIVFSVSMLIQF